MINFCTVEAWEPKLTRTCSHTSYPPEVHVSTPRSRGHQAMGPTCQVTLLTQWHQRIVQETLFAPLSEAESSLAAQAQPKNPIQVKQLWLSLLSSLGVNLFFCGV